MGTPDGRLHGPCALRPLGARRAGCGQGQGGGALTQASTLGGKEPCGESESRGLRGSLCPHGTGRRGRGGMRTRGHKAGRHLWARLPSRHPVSQAATQRPAGAVLPVAASGVCLFVCLFGCTGGCVHSCLSSLIQRLERECVRWRDKEKHAFLPPARHSAPTPRPLRARTAPCRSSRALSDRVASWRCRTAAWTWARQTATV